MLLDRKAFFDCNEATLHIFGCESREEFLDKHPSELSPANQPDGSDSMTLANERIATAYKDGENQFEWMHRRLDGTEFPAEVWLTRMELDGKDVLQATVRDITERKRAEEEKERLQAQLIQAQKMEAVGTLAGGVAHDFNNIMTAIKNLNSLAISKTGEKDLLKKYLEPISDVSERAIRLVQQLLIFSEVKPVKLATFNLNHTIDNLMNMLISLVSEDISIEKNLGYGLWNIEADEGRVEQVITNLIVNSRDAMPQGGKITLRTENITLAEEQSSAIQGATPGNFVCLTVEDTGTGMDKDTIEHIFEPFFTTRVPKRHRTGIVCCLRYCKGAEWVDRRFK